MIEAGGEEGEFQSIVADCGSAEFFDFIEYSLNKVPFVIERKIDFS